MDDPISALDANVKKKIFENVFNGMLQNKTRVLVTHAVDFLHVVDKVILLRNGEVMLQGSYEDIKEDPYLIGIMRIHKSHQEEQKELIEKSSPGLRKGHGGVGVPAKLEEAKIEDREGEDDEFESLGGDDGLADSHLELVEFTPLDGSQMEQNIVKHGTNDLAESMIKAKRSLTKDVKKELQGPALPLPTEE